MISIGEIVLVIVSIWGVCTWMSELVNDFKKSRQRGECIVAVEPGLNAYHFLGVMYLVILIGFRQWELSKYGMLIVTVAFFCLSGICVYRALRKQGIYTNGICIPEDHCSLESIRAYKWVSTDLDGYTNLYLQITYSNIMARRGIRVIKWTIPDQKIPAINAILIGLKAHRS